MEVPHITCIDSVFILVQLRGKLDGFALCHLLPCWDIVHVWLRAFN